MTNVSASEKEPGIEGVEQTPEIADTKPVEKKESKVKPLALDFDATHKVPRIDLLAESGVKVGQAEYKWLTTPDMINTSNIQLHEGDLAKANEIKDNIDDPAVAAEAIEHLTEDHLNAVLVVLFKKFRDQFGGDVCEATSVTFGQDSGVTGLQAGKDLESSGNRVSRNFIIPLSGREEMKSLLSGDISLSLGSTGSRFKIVNKDVPNALGNKGFSMRWEAPNQGQEPIVFDLNFFYGAEKNDKTVKESDSKDKQAVNEVSPTGNSEN